MTTDYSRLRRLRQLAVVCLFGLISAEAAAESRTDKRNGISLDYELPLGHGAYLPAQLHFTNGGIDRRLDIRLEQRFGFRTMGRTAGSLDVAMNLPPGATNVELPMLNASPGGSSLELSVTVDGRRSPGLSASASWYNRGDVVVVAIGDGFDNFVDRMSGISLTVEHALRRWQGYLGGRTIVLLRSGTISKLDMAQRSALKRWVMFGGGTLWIVGKEKEKSYRELGLVPGAVEPLPDLTDINLRRARLAETSLPAFPKRVTRHRAAAGSVVRSDAGDLEALRPEHLELMTEQLSETAGLFAFNETDAVKNSVFFELYDIPRGGFALLSLLLALLIGPVNLLILRKRKKMVLFYITTPVLAFIGMIALGAYSFASEGFRLNYNETALLLHDQEGNEGALYRARGFFGPFAPRDGIKLSTDTAAVPFFEEDNSSAFSSFETDWTSAQILTDGWIRSREESGLFTACPSRVRVGLRPIVYGPGDIRILNELKGTARDVLVWLNDKLYYTEEAPPGREVPLEPTNENLHDFTFPFVALEHLDWTVLARTEWLPGLENGAVEGDLRKQELYYVGLDTTKGEASQAEPGEPGEQAEQEEPGHE